MEDIKQKKSQNRNPVKQWFITFSQVREAVSKEEFNKILPPHDYSYTVEEEHEEEGYHFHMTVKLTKGITFSKLNKWFQEKLPNDYKRIHFKPVQNFENCINYCNKEDPKPVITGSLDKKKKVSEGVQRLLNEDEENRRMAKFLWEQVVKEREKEKTVHQEIWELKESREFKETVANIEEYYRMKEIEKERKRWREEGRDMSEFTAL